jgi:D-xylose transport system substrate-binding protein
VADQWKAEVAAAIAAGEWSAAKMAVGRWLSITPDDAQALAARQEIERQMGQDASRKKQEEAARAAEVALALEVTRKAEEERTRQEAERQAKEEADRKAREEQERQRQAELVAQAAAAEKAQQEAAEREKQRQAREAARLAEEEVRRKELATAQQKARDEQERQRQAAEKPVQRPSAEAPRRVTGVPAPKAKSNRTWLYVVGGAFAVVAVLILASIIPPTPVPTPTPAPAKPATQAPAVPPTAAPAQPIKIGISMSDFQTERWEPEAELMKSLLEEKGYEVLMQEANYDANLQNDQIDNMLSQGVKGLIIVAEDGEAAATAVDKAAMAGVKVIAYDRLIKSANVAAYLSFYNVDVGRNQADGVMKALLAGYDASQGPARVVKLGGSPTDNNAHLFRKGQDEIIDEYVKEGKIEIVADQWVDNWDPANAQQLLEDILSAQNNQVDAVVASNDGTALGALEALRTHGLAGKVPISGQDATAPGCNSIAKGELTVSILKDIRNLAPAAVNLMDKLVKGQSDPSLKSFTMAELTNDPSRQGNVQAYFLPVQQINKDNVYDLCVKNGFQSYDDVYRDIPESQRPPKP